MKRPTTNQRANATACLTDMAAESDALLGKWMNPDLDHYETQVAEMRELIGSIRHTLDVVEDITKDDLYYRAGKDH